MLRRNFILLVHMLLCCVFLCACNDSRGDEELLSDSETKEDITEESTETDRMAKGYDLPVSDSERKEAEDDCKEMMELISELYQNADKGYASNVIIADEIIDRMAEKLKSTGCPVPVTAEEIESYAVFDEEKQTYIWEGLGCFHYAPPILALPFQRLRTSEKTKMGRSH